MTPYRSEYPAPPPTRLDDWQVTFLGGVCIDGIPHPSMPSHVRGEGSERLVTSILLDCMGQPLTAAALGVDSPSQVAALLDQGMTVRTSNGSIYVLGSPGP